MKLLDFLNIKELGEIALKERKVPFRKIVVAYDPPEKQQVGQKLHQSADVWALGIVVLESLLAV